MSSSHQGEKLSFTDSFLRFAQGFAKTTLNWPGRRTRILYFQQLRSLDKRHSFPRFREVSLLNKNLKILHKLFFGCCVCKYHSVCLFNQNLHLRSFIFNSFPKEKQSDRCTTKTIIASLHKSTCMKEEMQHSTKLKIKLLLKGVGGTFFINCEWFCVREEEIQSCSRSC